MTVSGNTISPISYTSFWMGGPTPTPPPSGSYVKLRNRATNLCIDGMGRTSNGSICGQWSSSSSYNQQWTRETVGSYYKFKNRATGWYLDGMGSTSNGADLCQWSSSPNYNQQWSIVAP